jgi:hypothetical protein
MKLSRKVARETLRKANLRLNDEGDAEILHGGAWIEFGRTDLAGEAPCQVGGCVVEELRAELMEAAWGAVVDEDGFYVIDSATDG